MLRRRLETAQHVPPASSRTNGFAAMLNLWSVSVRFRGNDLPDHFMPPSRLPFPRSFTDDPVRTHPSPGPAVPGLDADFLHLSGHLAPAMAAKGQPRLRLDMRQNNPVHMRPAAGPKTSEGPPTVGADMHQPAQTINRENPAPAAPTCDRFSIQPSALRSRQNILYPHYEVD